MQIDNPFCQSKSQAVALYGMGSISLIELFKDPPLYFLAHASTVIRDRNLNRITTAAQKNPYDTAIRGEFNRVA